MRRKALEIKKRILEILKKEGDLSLRELERKVNTSYNTIKTQVEELEFFNRILITKHKKSDKNGRPYTTAKIK